MSDEDFKISLPADGMEHMVRFNPKDATVVDKGEQSLGDHIEVDVYGFAMLISRDMAIAHGIVEATPEERAALDAQSARWKAREEAYEQALVTFMETLGEFIKRDSAALRAVAEEHRRSEPGKYHIDKHICATCTEIAYDEDSVQYPCSTICTIAKAYGVEVPTL